MTASTAAGIVAILCFGCTAAIGRYVATRLPAGIDRGAMQLRGIGTPIAAAFTTLGRWYAIATIAAVAAVAALALRHPVVPVLALFVSEVFAQGVVSSIKAIVRRDRPAMWLLRLEGDSSFPSGHATTSVVFFIGLGLIVQSWHAGGAATGAVWFAVAACALGIPWSRLALGAHYATDVLGGLLFGAGWLIVTLAAFQAAGIAPAG